MDNGDNRRADSHSVPMPSDPVARNQVYAVLSHYLPAQTRGSLMQTEKIANATVGSAPFPQSNVSMRDISHQLSGFAPVGLHGTSASDAPGLYKGVSEPPQASRTFKDNLGGQLGPGFYITDGFGPGEKNAAHFYAAERAKVTKSPPEIMRAHVQGMDQLGKVAATGDKKSKWWPKTGTTPDYLKPYAESTHTYTHSETGLQQTVTKRTGADVVTAQMGGLNVSGGPMPEHFDGRTANQVKLNWHALQESKIRPAAQVMMTPHDTSGPLPPSFLAAVAARKK